MCGVYVHIFFIFLLLSAVFTFEYAQRLIWLQVIFARFFADSPSDGFVFVRRLHLSIGLCAPFFTSSMKVHASSIVESENFRYVNSFLLVMDKVELYVFPFEICDIVTACS